MTNEHTTTNTPERPRKPREEIIETMDEAAKKAKELMPDPADEIAVHFDEEINLFECWLTRPGRDPRVIAKGKTLNAMIWDLESGSYPKASAQRVRVAEQARKHAEKFAD